MSQPIQSETFNSLHLRDFVAAVFTHYMVPEADASQAAEILVASDLRGIDSHGVARLNPYLTHIKSGRINPRPKISIIRETQSTATVDGDAGLGLVVGPLANELAIKKAAAVGSGWVSVSNSNHFGIAGYYPLQALKHDMIGMAMTNASPIVAPLWGAQGMLGTNPIAIAFPGKNEPPIVIDMATSVAAYGKLEIAKRQGNPIPKGWAIDAEGRPATYPDEMMQGGALLPLGATRTLGGHKGYALAAMVDILSSVLSGANWGPFAPAFAPTVPLNPKQVGKGLGHFFGAWRIDGFIDPDIFKHQIDDWIHTFRTTKPTPGTEGPVIPGDPERAAETARLINGVPLLEPVVTQLREISRQTGIPMPQALTGKD